MQAAPNIPHILSPPPPASGFHTKYQSSPRVRDQQSEAPLSDLFQSLPERAHPRLPPSPQRHPPTASVSPTDPPTLALPIGRGSAKQVAFSPYSGSPTAPPNPSWSKRILGPYFSSPGGPRLHPPRQPTSLPKHRQGWRNRSLSVLGTRFPATPAGVPSTGARAPRPGDNSASPRARRPGPRPLRGRHSPGKHTT